MRMYKLSFNTYTEGFRTAKLFPIEINSNTNCSCGRFFEIIIILVFPLIYKKYELNKEIKY